VADLNARDTKLVQYLNEALTKEKQLETALEAHIGMTTLTPYRKRLRQHLNETKRHGREVQRRIKQLGGEANGITGVVQEVAAKGAALAQGPIHAVRGTSEQETHLKNARTEFKEEAEEIGTYTMIQNLAEKVGDRDTASLAKAILREEKRMAGFLEKLIPRLTKAVAQAEIPASQRNGGRRRTSSRRSSSTRGTARKSASRKSTARKSSTRKTTARKSSTRKSTARKSGARKTSARKTSARSRSASSRSRTASRSGSSRSSSGRKSARRTTARSR
jgi:ferritin-like metal-binding protein YciE